MEETLKLLVFGGFELTTATGRPVSVPVRKARALLAWLALQPDHDHPRERLATLLWSDAAESQARHSLRQALSALRKASPVIAGGLSAGHDHVRLDPSVIEVDALTLVRRADGGEADDGRWLLQSYRGDFLEGMIVHSPPFDDWLMEQREHFRHLAAGQFESALRRAIGEKRFADAIRLGIRLVNLEPLREDVHRTLMESYAAAGRIPDALQQYRVCRATLERQIGVAPSRETEALKVSLLSERGRVPPRPAVSPESRAASPRRRPELRQVTLVAVAPPPGAARDDPQFEDRELSRLVTRCETFARRQGLVPPIAASHCAVLVFGSPATSSNDSLRALHAATAIAAPGDARVAVASGRAVVHLSSLANDAIAVQRLSGAVLRQVETMCDFPQDMPIVISESVRLSCIDHVSVSGPLDHVLPGGVATWRLDALDTQRPVRPMPGFVGRRLELGQLEMMLEFCREGGHGHVFMIRGDAGIGKSRLAHKALDAAASGGDVCLQHRVGAPGGTSQGGLAAGIVSGLVAWMKGQAGDSPGVGDVRACLETLQVERDLVDYAAALFQPVDDEGRRTVMEHLDADGRRAVEQRLFESLVNRVGEKQSFVLLVEDIHWAGDMLMTQLADLAALTTSHRLVLAMTSRLEGEALSASWRGATSGAPMTTIDLKPLPESECRRLAERLAGSEHPRLADCVARSGGNPLFLEQLLLAADHGDRALPDSIHSIVGSRLDALDDPERRAIRAAAVLGARFPLPALEHMLPDAREPIDSLLGHGLLVTSGQEGRFLHELIHRGIYDSTLLDERSELHRRAASYYESRDDYRHAWHVISGRTPDAITVCREVAGRLIVGYEFDRAAALVDRALSISPASRELAAMRGRICQATGAYRDAAAWFRKALAASPFAEASIGLAEALIVLDRYDEALDCLGRLEATLARGDHESRVKVEILSSRIAFAKGYLGRCLDHGKRARELARHVGSVDLQIESISAMADARYQQGQMSRARALFDRCVSLAGEHGARGHESVNLAMRAWTSTYLGRIGEGVREAERALALATEIGHRRHQAFTASVMAEVAYEHGEVDRGVDYARQCVAVSRSVGSLRFELEAACLIGYHECVRGNRERGFAQVLDGAQRMVDLRPAYAGPWLLAMAGYFAPGADTARALFEQGEDIMREIDCVSHNPIHFYQYAIGRMLLEGDLDETRRYLERFEAYLGGRDVPIAARYCERARRMLSDPAAEQSQRAMEAFRRVSAGLGLNFMSLDSAT